RPLTEEEIADLKERHYDSIAEKQRVVDLKLQSELALQEEKLRLEEEALYAAQRQAARAAKQKKLLEQRRQHRITQQRAHAVNNGEFQSCVAEEDLDPFLRNTKFQYEAFRSSRLSSDATVLTPNTESSCDLMTKTKSSRLESRISHLSSYKMAGMNRMIPVRERSRTEEDILRAALKFNSRKPGSHPASASDDSNGLEWENDFVSAAAALDDNGNSEYAGFVNPVLELSECERQDR
ncbi:AP1AR protein, partial [Passerina amoena]|nr:AP1AR protein [Passerina amoena]